MNESFKLPKIFTEPKVILSEILTKPKVIKKLPCDERTIRALLYANEMAFRASEDVDYDWVLTYSESRIKYLKRSVLQLEKKASALMKYLAGGAALLGAIFSYAPIKDHAVFFVPSALALLAATLFASRTSFPDAHSGPPTIKEAFDYANQCNRDAELLFTRTSMMIEFDLVLLVTQKAHFVRLALIQFLLGVTWLVIAACLTATFTFPRPDVLVSMGVVDFGLLLVVVAWTYQTFRQRMRLCDQMSDWLQRLTWQE